MQSIVDELCEALSAVGFSPKRNESMACHTTFSIGGEADIFLSLGRESDLLKALNVIERFDVEVFLLGGGSNILVGDGGIRGIVLKDESKGVELQSGRVKIDSGHSLSTVVEDLCNDGIGGLEFLAGIPGTLGGAICGNAGAYGIDISQRLHSIRILRKGAIDEVPPEALEYSYRSSRLKKQGLQGPLRLPEMIVLSAILDINENPRNDPKAELREILDHRRNRLPPWELPCAGSYFKNLPAPSKGERRIAAGKLLDEVGAKELSVGAARVYEKHANIIVNGGGAKAWQVLALAEEMAERVKREFSVDLEAEVMTIGHLQQS